MTSQLPLTKRKRRAYSAIPWQAPTSNVEWVYRPLLSVVLPVYNQADYLRSSVTSVLEGQKFPLELIIVNDGSTEKKVSTILKEFKKYSRVKIINQENQGLARALNRGFSEARGGFLTWTSADNCYLPGTLDKMSDYLLANPSVGLVYGNVNIIDETGELLSKSNYRVTNQNTPGSAHLVLPNSGNTLSLFNDNFINACFMYRHVVKDTVGDYNPKHPGFEDYDYWLRANLQFDIAHIDTEEALYEYRLHKSSLTSALSTNELALSTAPLLTATQHKQQLIESGVIVSLQSRSDNIEVTNIIKQSLSANRIIFKAKDLSQKDELLFDIELIGAASYEEGQTIKKKVPTAKIVGVRPTESPKETILSHSSHIRFTNSCYPLYLKKREGDSTRSRLVLPPLSIPEILLRARDNSYFACTPENGTELCALIFSPDSILSPSIFSSKEDKSAYKDYRWAIKNIKKIITTLSDITFILYCENDSQRNSADAINSSLKDNNSRLRIIDATKEDKTTSLMYALSSVEAVISIKKQTLNIDSILETRIEAALAGSAGIGCIALTNNLPSKKEPFAHEVLSSFTPMPNLGIATDLNKLEESLLSATHGIQPNSTHQWLKENSFSSLGDNIIKLLIS